MANKTTIPTKEQMQHTLEERHGKELQQAFSNAAVAICGLGGLGSNIAVSLARAGIGKLILIDFARVDISNLHRQQYKPTQIGLYKTEALASNLKEIAPYFEIRCHTTKITENNFQNLLSDTDIICEAFDNPEAKAMLVNGILEHMPKKYLIAASGMAGLYSSNSIKTRRITRHFYLCGDEVSEVSANTSDSTSGTNSNTHESEPPCILPQNIGLVSSRVMLCAAHQAHMVLRILAQEYEP